MSADTGPLPYFLREASRALQSAERQLDHDVRSERDAMHRELVAAAASIGRVMHLAGIERAE